MSFSKFVRNWTPLGWYQKLVGKLFGSPNKDITTQIFDVFSDLDIGRVLENVIKEYTGIGMTDSSKEEVDYSTNAQYELWRQTQSMPAQVAQYKEAGINPMMLANGSGVGSVPSAGTPSSGGADLLGTIFNFILGSKKLKLTEEIMPFQMEALSAQAGLNNTRANEINQLLPERVENLRENTNLLIERALSEQYQQDLLAVGVTQKEAEAALLIRQEAILAIDEKNRQRFLDIDMDLKSAQARMANAAANRDFAEVARIQQETANLRVEHDNLLKEGVGITLNNGKMAHEFNILSKEAANAETRIKQENAGRVVDMVCTGINSVVGVVNAASGVGNMTAALKTAASSESRAETYRSNSKYDEDTVFYDSKGKVKGRTYRKHR